MKGGTWIDGGRTGVRELVDESGFAGVVEAEEKDVHVLGADAGEDGFYWKRRVRVVQRVREGRRYGS